MSAPWRFTLVIFGTEVAILAISPDGRIGHGTLIGAVEIVAVDRLAGGASGTHGPRAVAVLTGVVERARVPVIAHGSIHLELIEGAGDRRNLRLTRFVHRTDALVARQIAGTSARCAYAAAAISLPTQLPIAIRRAAALLMADIAFLATHFSAA